jgi:hypothetical protein
MTLSALTLPATPDDAGAGPVGPNLRRVGGSRVGTTEPLGVDLRVVAWEDPVVERLGFTPQSRYVELFWLPVLGPSACLLLRRMADLLVEAPAGVTVSTDDTARALGLGGAGGRHAPFPRALQRCVRYGLARPTAPDTVAFRRMVGPLPRRLVRRLPAELQQRHAGWEDAGPGAGGATPLHRAKVIALESAGGAPHPAAVEQHLHALGVHPALADQAARWVADALPAAWPPRPGGPSTPAATDQDVP